MSRLTSKVLAFGLLVLGAVTASAQMAPEDRHFIKVPTESSRRISLDFKNASLTEVLKIFSKQSGMNFIAADDVSRKKITLFLEDIAVDEALEKILTANNLEYDMQPGSNIFIVRTKISADRKRITKVFQLKHASVSSSKLRKTFSINASSSASNSGSSSSGSSSSSSGKSSGGAQQGGAKGASDPSEAKGISEVLKAVMSSSGVLTEDTRTNSLIVTDFASFFPAIEDTIAQLDVEVPEILIEVEMLDISKSTSDLLGVKWGETIFKFNGASKISVLPFNQSDLLKDGKLNLVPADSTDNIPLSPYTAGNISFGDMQAVINFLNTRVDTRNLARPRLLTLNNETAQIKITTDEAIGIKTTNFSSTSATQSAVEAERVETGVVLTVTPQANLITREILMAVYPKVIQARRGGTFDGHSFNDPEERGTQAFLRIKDGMTLMIGGLMRTNDENTRTAVPILSKLPLVGGAFRHKNSTDTKRELIIFLTPHIIDDRNRKELLTGSLGNFRMEEVNKALLSLEQQGP